MSFLVDVSFDLTNHELFYSMNITFFFYFFGKRISLRVGINFTWKIIMHNYINYLW